MLPQPNTPSCSPTNQTNNPPYTDRCLSNCPSTGFSKIISSVWKLEEYFKFHPAGWNLLLLLKHAVLLLKGVPNSSLAPTLALRPCTEAAWLTTSSGHGGSTIFLLLECFFFSLFFFWEGREGRGWIFADLLSQLETAMAGKAGKSKGGSRPPLLAAASS